jgi:hypothetical protein
MTAVADRRPLPPYTSSVDAGPAETAPCAQRRLTLALAHADLWSKPRDVAAGAHGWSDGWYPLAMSLVVVSDIILILFG